VRFSTKALNASFESSLWPAAEWRWVSRSMKSARPGVGVQEVGLHRLQRDRRRVHQPRDHRLQLRLELGLRVQTVDQADAVGLRRLELAGRK